MDGIKDAMGLDKLHHDFVEAFRGNDTVALGAFYSESAVLLPPGHRTLVGRAAIVAFWQGATLIQSLRFEPAQLQPIGDRVVREAGTLEITLRGTNAGIVAASYLSLWTREDGAWKLESTIWNRREREDGRRPQAQGGRGRAGRGAAPAAAPAAEDLGQGGGTVTYGGRRSRAVGPGRGPGRRQGGGPAPGPAGRRRGPDGAPGQGDPGPRGGTYGQAGGRAIPGGGPGGPGGGAYGQRPRGSYGPKGPGPQGGADTD